MRPPSAHRNGGFTLAEVIVAVMIFGLAATVLGRAVSDAMRAYGMARHGGADTYVAEQVRQHVLTLPSRSQIEDGGELEVPVLRRASADATETTTEMVRVRWEAELFSTNLLDVFRIDLGIRLETGDNRESMEQSLLAYRPAWTEADDSARLIEAKEEAFSERLTARGELEEGGAE
jgi:prepilin-type N-terminal cleavage/methylation domain-containing protein